MRQEREVTILGPNARVRWIGANPDGWAGPGIARIVAFDPRRAHFPGGTKGTKDEPKRGPAYEIKLEHNGLRQWVSVIEVEPVDEEQAA